MPPGSSAPRVLIAGTEGGLRLIAEVLGDEATLVAAGSVRAALEKLMRDGPFDRVVCNVRFDESRMFDFLDALRAAELTPPPTVVCINAGPAPLSPRTQPAIKAALEALGVQTLLDFPELAVRHGEQVARETLRAAILGAA